MKTLWDVSSSYRKHEAVTLSRPSDWCCVVWDCFYFLGSGDDDSHICDTNYCPLIISCHRVLFSTDHEYLRGSSGPVYLYNVVTGSQTEFLSKDPFVSHFPHTCVFRGNNHESYHTSKPEFHNRFSFPDGKRCLWLPAVRRPQVCGVHEQPFQGTQKLLFTLIWWICGASEWSHSIVWLFTPSAVEAFVHGFLFALWPAVKVSAAIWAGRVSKSELIREVQLQLHCSCTILWVFSFLPTGFRKYVTPTDIPDEVQYFAWAPEGNKLVGSVISALNWVTHKVIYLFQTLDYWRKMVGNW